MTYVAGFLFDKSYETVALIVKQKPQWQKGRLNGIGGKLEPNESPRMAMAREFKEETGCTIPVDAWHHFCTLDFEGASVFFFMSTADAETLRSLKTTTDEEVVTVSVRSVLLREFDTIPNIPWLCAMAISLKTTTESASAFSVREVQ